MCASKMWHEQRHLKECQIRGPAGQVYVPVQCTPQHLWPGHRQQTGAAGPSQPVTGRSGAEPPQSRTGPPQVSLHTSRSYVSKSVGLIRWKPCYTDIVVSRARSCAHATPGRGISIRYQGLVMCASQGCCGGSQVTVHGAVGLPACQCAPDNCRCLDLDNAVVQVQCWHPRLLCRVNWGCIATKPSGNCAQTASCRPWLTATLPRPPSTLSTACWHGHAHCPDWPVADLPGALEPPRQVLAGHRHAPTLTLGCMTGCAS